MHNLPSLHSTQTILNESSYPTFNSRSGSATLLLGLGAAGAAGLAKRAEAELETTDSVKSGLCVVSAVVESVRAVDKAAEEDATSTEEGVELICWVL